MKKLFFLFSCMLIPFYIQAQYDSAAAPKALDSMLVNIDQSTVRTGIIYERTYQKANLYNYNSKDYSHTAEYSYLNPLNFNL
ncbi:hypothetical protein [Flavobacterium tegetincola]|uniref:hypothetical protein n=2 Tax=Flavobacterium tegetincola TaxID=150172 RepID=UPI000407E299|nr:hypothetical protein [Flavobacterium tegetincola]